MSIFQFLRRPPKASAVEARERLQILLAHERASVGGSDILPALQQEILAVISKYMEIDRERVQVKLDRGGEVSVLEVNVELPVRPIR